MSGSGSEPSGQGAQPPTVSSGSVAAANPTAPSRRSSFSRAQFSEGGAFSLARIFGGSSIAGQFGGVSNDVAQANSAWRDRADYDEATQGQRETEEERQREQERLRAIDQAEADEQQDGQAAAESGPHFHDKAEQDASRPSSSQPTAPASPCPDQPEQQQQQQYPRLTLPRLPKTGQSRTELHLSRIQNPKIRAWLDPCDASIRPQDFSSWSREELQELVDAIEPVHLTGIIRKSVEWLSSERCKPLSFSDISLRNANGRYALRNVSGFLNPGQTVAILSAPDAGTTNLLNVLAGRQETGEIRGEILYDGRPRDASFQRHVGYVPKEDLEFPLLTVKETLMFSANCRTPYVDERVTEFKVNLSMKLLGLSHAANTYIGDATIKGVSGGEKRRVSYGVEMVAGHGCIIADLPTNGLDSASAYALIKTIRYINRSGGRSMMCSIVQPAPALYHLFDSVMLLSKGSVFYFGATDKAIQFVEAAGFVRPKGKSEPQFLEELTATPERFYVTRLQKEGQLSQEQTQATGEAGKERQQAQQQTERRSADSEEGKELDDAAMATERQREPTEEMKRNEEELKSAIEMQPMPDSKADDDGKLQQDRAAAMAGSSAASSQEVAVDVAQQGGQGTGDVAGEATKSATEAAPEEEVHEYTLGDERVMGTPQRMAAWKLLTERYAVSVFAERVVGVIEKDKQRAQQEEAQLAAAGNHSSTQRSTEAQADGKGQQQQHSSIVRYHDPQKAAKQLPQFTQSMGIIAMRRDKTELEMEQHGPGGGEHRFNRTFAQQVKECIHRQFLLTYRTPGLWFGSWIKASLMAIIAGTLFLNLPDDAEYGRSFLGLFFFLALYIGVGAVEILAFLMQSRSIYYQQRKAGYFRGVAYYIAVIVSQIPLSLVETFVFSITVYGLAGLRDNVGSGRFWYFWLVILTTNMTSRCWVFNISTIAPNAAVAFVIIPISNVLFVQFAGFLESRSAIPVAWIWMNYASFYCWAWRGLATNQLYGLTLANPQPGLFDYTSGTQVLQAYDIDNDEHYKWYDLLWLTVFCFFFFAMGAFVILSVDWSRADTPQTPDFGEEAAAKKRKAEEAKRQLQKEIASKTGGKQLPASDAAARATEGGSAAAAAATASTAGDAERGGNKQLSRRRSSQGSRRQRGSYVSHQRDAYFQWRHLTYTVVLSNGTERKLLTDCFGYARPGIMVALMGASGAGKSTLLDVLAGKKTAGHMEGEVLLNGKAFDARSFNHTAAYAEQFDSHQPMTTVKEAIAFSALLRLPSHITSQDGEVERRVMHVMDALDLQHSANDIIGAPGFGGVSPEVRKKVTIAVELVMDPALIFLDEPTTGLDSAGAFAVMSSVKKLAQEMAVICTIHQPSNEIVHMFDWLLLLQPGGQVVFFGPVKELVPFFVQNGIAQAPDNPDSPDLNVADFALDAIRSANAMKGKEGAVDMVKAFEQSERCKQIQAELDKNTGGGDLQQDDGQQQASDMEKGLTLAEQNASLNANVNANAPSAPAGGNAAGMNDEDDHQYPGFMFQLYLLTQRNVRSTWRNRLTFKTRYFTAVVLGFVCGTLFFQLDHSQEAASSRVSVLFVATIIPMFLSSSSLADVFAVRPLYFREYTSRMYGAAAWFFARRLADVPYYVVEVTIFGTMLYWIANMRSSNNGGYFFWFLFTLFGVRAAGSAFTQAVATAFASPEVAAAFQSTAFTIFFLFAGFLIPEPLIRTGWIWMYYLSFIRYPLDFLLGNEFASVPFDCSGYTNSTDCPVPNGDTILGEFGVEYDLGHEAINFIVLWIFLAGFLLFGFLALRFINHIKR